MDRTTLPRNLDLLERDGLVRSQVEKDARVREVELTPAAHKKLTAACWPTCRPQSEPPRTDDRFFCLGRCRYTLRQGKSALGGSGSWPNR